MKVRQKTEIKAIHSIRLKLMTAFMLLAVLLVVLGITSYRKAAEGIIGNYENAMNSSMNMLLRYMNTVCQAAEAKNVQLTCNKTLQRYYGGEFGADKIEEKNKAKEMASLLYATAMTEENISEIYVIASTGKPIGAMNNLLDADIFTMFSESEEYAQVQALEKQKTLWLGYHRGLDAAADKTPEDYSISCVRKLTDAMARRQDMLLLTYQRNL